MGFNAKEIATAAARAEEELADLTELEAVAVWPRGAPTCIVFEDDEGYLLGPLVRDRNTGRAEIHVLERLDGLPDDSAPLDRSTGAVERIVVTAAPALSKDPFRVPTGQEAEEIGRQRRGAAQKDRERRKSPFDVTIPPKKGDSK